jgi:hypothetical protein
MRSRHSTRTCYQISLRLRFDATETRAYGRERRRCHVKGLIAWPKALSLVGLFPECIVTRTVSIKACARHRRRGDRATVRGIYKLTYLHAEIACIASPEIRTKRMLIFKLQHGMAGHKMVLRRSNVRKRMSALGQKRTSQHVRAMSALPPKADISWLISDVR